MRRRVNRYGRGLAVAAALLAIGLGASPAAAAADKPVPAKPTVPAAAPHGADAALSLGINDNTPGRQVAVAMQQMHLTVCAAAVQRATDFIFEGQPATFIAQPFGPDGDRWPTVFVIESADPAGGHTRLSTLMVAPNCSGMYEQIIYWSEPCATLKSTIFAKFTGEHPLLRDVRVSDAGPALQLYLTPAGAGCVSVKKELFR